MNLTRAQKRRSEVAVVIALYTIVFSYLIGPVIGGLTGLTKPAIENPAIGRPSLVHPFTTVRGWLLILSLAVVTFSYIYYRPRLTGHDPSTFWTDGDEDGD